MTGWAISPQRRFVTELILPVVAFASGITADIIVSSARPFGVRTIVLTRDAEGKRPDQRFYCTNLDWSPQQILSAYAARWSIEVTFENCKQHLGLEDPANRTEKAVRRTAPMALFQYSLIVLWFHQTGHRHVRFPDRPWYLHKSEPSFADMLTTLRRISWEDQLSTVRMQSRVARKTLAPIIEFLSLTG